MSAPETTTATRWVSVINIPKMDCPSEERMIRMALDGWDAVETMQFDLAARQLKMVHRGDALPIMARLEPLGFGAFLASSVLAPAGHPTPDNSEASTLRWLLAINALMFVIELAVGWWAQSTGLIADSLDMFADAAVYGLALFAVGRAAQLKLRAAHLAGWLQIVLAVGALGEVGRRFIIGSEPDTLLMTGMALVALMANTACLVIISRNQSSGVHMKASQIFSANDVIANLGVVVAGLAVYWTGSNIPDLMIGVVIAVVVLQGGRKILRLRG